MNAIHITTARHILDARDPVRLAFWTRRGEIRVCDHCVSLNADFRTGTRKIKLLRSGEIRRVRDVCIFSVNDCEVFL